MRPISQMFLSEEPEIAIGDTGDPKAIKTTPDIKRVDLQELELTYLHNPTIFNGVNKIVQTIMSANHEIVANDKNVKNYFDKFTENLGNSGSDITWDELLSDIFKHQCIYGRSFIENIYNKRQNSIVDWDILDPKKIDYAKDKNGKIVLDKFSRPVGYFQTIPLGEDAVIKDQVLPQDVIAPAQGKSIFLEPKFLAQMKLFTVGDAFYPIGIIEPIYKTSLRKMNIEDALANAIYRLGFPIVWAQLGDMNHEPTPQQVENMLKKLKDLTNKSEIATPYYYNLQILESKKSEKLKEHLDYFREQEIAGMGIPKPFATGSAGGATMATLGKQDAMFQLTLRDIIRKTIFSIEKYMFAPICRLEHFKEVPKIKWDIVGTDELDRKAKRLFKYVQAGLIDPDIKISEFIKKTENLE